MTHSEYMRECFRLARQGAGHVNPNPMVGAVLVRNGRIIARGYHRAFGGPHAEVECLAHARGDLSDALLYVNLEPCSHHGKTPPCVDRIIEAGVGHVVLGMRDPNPLVAGRGIRILRRNGIRVTTGILAEEAAALNRPFVVSMTLQRPFVHLKAAVTLDGFIAPAPPRQLWLTSRESRTLVHRWRTEHDALLVGAGTIAHDNPELNVRLVKGRNPVVVVLDGNLRISPRARIFSTGARVLVITARPIARQKPSRVKALARIGAVVLGLPGTAARISPHAAVTELFRHGVHAVMVEGGSEVFSQFLQANLCDRLSLFIAPKVLTGGIPFTQPSRMFVRARRMLHCRNLSSRRVGSDILVQAEFDSGN